MPASIAVREDTASDIDLSGVTVADIDSSTLTVTVTANTGTFTVADGASVGAGVTEAGGGTNTITLMGSAADINTFLDTASNIQYTNASNVSGTVSANIAVSDGDLDTGFQLFTLPITAVNDAPTLTLPAMALEATEQEALEIGGQGIQIQDVDAVFATVRMTLSVGEGVLDVDLGTLMQTSIISGNGSGTVVLEGPIFELNTLLNCVPPPADPGFIRFTADSDNPSAMTTLTVTVNDLGNTGEDPGLTGDAMSEEVIGVVNINIAGVNDAPTISGVPTDLQVLEDTASNVDLSGVTLEDLDGDALTLTLTIDAGTFSAPADGSMVGSGVTATLVDGQTITLVGSAADINTYLDTASNIQYTGAQDANGDDAATLTASVTDGSMVQGAGIFAASFDLSSLDGTNGFVINGINADDYSGYFVSGAGDVNGDGIDDVIIGARGADTNGNLSGESYVVFGTSANFTSIDLSNLDGTNGFTLSGVSTNDRSGTSVSSAGDINGDGIDDIIIGAPNADVGVNTNAGESYVVFGTSVGFDSTINLSALNGTNGFIINGVNAVDYSGTSVSSVGDVNGDGIDDIVIGARNAGPGGGNDTGDSYVVFGSTDGFNAVFDLSSLNGSNGFVLNGVDGNDQSGFSVSSAGDVNGDGIDDILIGARLADQNGNESAGESYVVFGTGTGFNASIDLSALNGTNGFALNGIDLSDQSGFSVSTAGDLNGDGFDDIIIGAYLA